MIAHDVPGMVFFTMTGEYVPGDAETYACKHRLGKWFSQVLPVGSQIDLLREEIRRYAKCHACEPGQDLSWFT